MGTSPVGEQVRVCVAFDKRRVVPVWFRWANRYYRVRRVCFTWCSDQGAARIYHYSVTDGANVYELQFNSATLEWTLAGVSSE